MGQEILYCFKCQERVTSAELEASKGLRFGLRTACKKCVPDLLAALSEQERKELVAKVQAASAPDPRTSTGKYVLSSTTPRSRSVSTVPATPASGSNSVWAVAAGVVAIVIAAIVLLMNSGGSTPPREAPTPSPTGKPATESGRDRAAREALNRAKGLPASDLEAQVSAYAEAARLAGGTPYEREARERHEGVLEMRRKAYVRDIVVIEERAKALANKEEFGASIALFETSRTLHAAPEWKTQIDAEVDLYRKAADTAFADVKAKASLAREKGAEDELKALLERVSRWGLPQLGKDLDAHLAALPPPVDARPWTPIFDGKSLDFLIGKGEGSWVVENGLLKRVMAQKPSAQTKRQFTDGEFRIRFEGRRLTHAGFAFRQGLGYYGVGWNRKECEEIGDREHELLVVLRGNEALATLDGKPQKIEKFGKTPFVGPLQFNAYGEYFAVRVLEFREPGPNDGLVGHWTFDSINGTSVPDSSPTKNDGLLVDAPILGPGRLGNALQFDGRRSYVKVPSHPALTLTGPFTLSVWVKPSAVQKSAALVEKWEDKDGYLLRLLSGLRPTVVFRDASGDTETSSQKSIPAGEWTFLAGTFDGASLKLYVNGVLDRSLVTAKSPLSNAQSLVIGVAGGGGAHYFSGAIDDVRVYNRALSADELARLAQGK